MGKRVLLCFSGCGKGARALVEGASGSQPQRVPTKALAIRCTASSKEQVCLGEQDILNCAQLIERLTGVEGMI